MTINNVREDWYSQHRKKIMDHFKIAKPLSNRVKKYQSPSGKYTVVVTPVEFRFRNKKTKYIYTIGTVYQDGKMIFNVHRNAPDFPYLFVEDHEDGFDYLLCAEDNQARTVVQLNTSKARSFISEKSQRGIEFCWQKLHTSENAKVIAVEGYVKHKPKDKLEYREIRFYKFSDIMDLPWKEIGERINFPYEEFISWENDSHYTLAIHEEVRYTDNMKVNDLTQAERKNSLLKDEIRLKKIFYKFPLQEGIREEVYSEWI